MIRLGKRLCFEDKDVCANCFETVKNIFPDGYKYMISDFALLERSKIVGEEKFNVVFRVDIANKDDINGFITKLGQKSGTTYNRFCGDIEGTGKKVVIRGYRKCHHNVRRHSLKPDATHNGPGRQPGTECVPGKNTECPALLKFSLSGSHLHGSRSKKLSLTRQNKDKYPLEVTLEFNHNHSINSADALRYRPVSDDVKIKFIELFNNDYTASSAFAKYKEDLRNTCTEDEFTVKMADRAVMPDYFWVFHLHAQYIENKFGSINGVDAYQRAVDKIKQYNDRHGLKVAKIAQTEKGETIVATCDPFCRRIHENLPQAGDIVLVDATSNLDRQDTKLFHIICPSPAGGMPLGNIIVSREDEPTVSAGFELYQSLLPAGAFFGRGAATGPKIAMTDDSQVEQSSLSKIWPNVTLLLCVFHLLQALWRWEWNSDRKIDKHDRPTLFNLFKNLLYAKTDSEYVDAKNNLFGDPTVDKYPQFVKHLNEDILPRKDEWAMCVRSQRKLYTHNVNTTNYVEISFRITKDNQFNRVKAYNLPDLLEIVLDDSAYYVQRCIDIGNNRVSQIKNQRSRYRLKKCNIDRSKIVSLDNGVPNSYLVPSERIEGKMYEVNMDLGVCQCEIGKLRGPCKHKQIVADHFKIACSDLLPENDPKVRAFYHFLATGIHQNSNWYRSLNQEVATNGDNFNNPDLFGFMREHDSTNEIPPLEGDENDEQLVSDDVIDDSIDMDVEPGLSNDTEKMKQDFKDAVLEFRQEVLDRVNEDPDTYSKCIKSFTKQLKMMSSMNHSRFQKCLFSLVDAKSMPVKKGRRKIARNIPVQKTSKSRRLYKIRGSQGAPKGRPTGDIVKSKNTETVYHCLPKQKGRKRKNPHSISASVSANRAAEKKH